MLQSMYYFDYIFQLTLTLLSVVILTVLLLIYYNVMVFISFRWYTHSDLIIILWL